MEHSEVLSNHHTSKSLNRLTITDLLGLFPRPNAPNNPILSPLKPRCSPSAVTDTSEFVSREGKDVQKRRSSPKVLLERHDGTEFPWIECRGLPGAVHNQAVQDKAQYSLHPCSIELSMLAGQKPEARNGSHGVMANDAAVFAAIPSSIGQCASGLDPSQLQSPEVPSRSSLSGDLRTTLSLEQDDLTGSYRSGAKERIVSIPLPWDVERPTRPTRRVQAGSSFLREDTFVPQTVRPGLLGSTLDFSAPTVARRVTREGYYDPSAAAIGEMKGSLKMASKKSLEHVRSQSLSTLDHGDRTASELASNFPTEASYMMAVTEQEMALLLMMRHKRAAI